MQVTVDKAALKKGFWGNTWKNWGELLHQILLNVLASSLTKMILKLTKLITA